MTSTFSAFTIALVKQHCRYHRYQDYSNFLIHGAMLATQIAIAPKSVSTIASLGISSFLAMNSEFKDLYYLSYIPRAIYAGFYAYKCYYYPEEIATTVADLAITVGGTLIGDKKTTLLQTCSKPRIGVHF